VKRKSDTIGLDERSIKPIGILIKEYRKKVENILRPLISSHYSALLQKNDNEYRKMIELSTKMMIVGHACTEIAGFSFDSRHQLISGLYGGCCFLADSFIDDFGETAARDYLRRFELLLTKGWFDIRNDRERLFYIIICRLFTERDVLDPMLRQAIVWLYLAQKRDLDIRLNAATFKAISRRRQLNLLRQCARDRSGHAIIVLSRFLVPELPLKYHHFIFTAGSLIMHIDDHGDYYSDLNSNRITYMNQVSRPAKTLQRIFNQSIFSLQKGLPAGTGRDLMISFLLRYYVTRIKKHNLEKNKGDLTWTVYE